MGSQEAAGRIETSVLERLEEGGYVDVNGQTARLAHAGAAVIRLDGDGVGTGAEANSRDRTGSEKRHGSQRRRDGRIEVAVMDLAAIDADDQVYAAAGSGAGHGRRVRAARIDQVVGICSSIGERAVGQRDCLRDGVGSGASRTLARSITAAPFKPFVPLVPFVPLAPGGPGGPCAP